MRKILGMLLIVLSGAAWGQAQNAWWHSVASNVAKNDGSVTLTDANGNPVNVVANPTAAVVKPNQAAVTQPPTVIVQATTGYWKDPVASWASLPTTGNSVGDTRMVTSLGFAFTWNGSTWTPLAADQNGNMTAKTFIPTLIATAGQPCSNPGQSASSGSGPLFCQSGVWVGGGEPTCNANGCYAKQVGGMIIEWGALPVASVYGPYGESGCYSFPLPFPTGLWTVSATPTIQSPAAPGGITLGALVFNQSSVGFCASFDTGDASAGYGGTPTSLTIARPGYINFIAIGS